MPLDSLNDDFLKNQTWLQGIITILDYLNKQVSIKRTVTSHLNSLNTKIRSRVQECKCGGLKRLMESQPTIS